MMMTDIDGIEVVYEVYDTSNLTLQSLDWYTCSMKTNQAITSQ